MDPTTPVTTGPCVQTLWALALGLVVPWLVLWPLCRLIDRWRDRRACRRAEAAWQAWVAAHPPTARDDLERLGQIREQLRLESLPPHVCAHLLRQRLEDAERAARAQAILDAERRAARDGETRPEEDSHENRLL